MTINITPEEVADLLRSLLTSGPEQMAVKLPDLPAAIREIVKPYLGRGEEE